MAFSAEAFDASVWVFQFDQPGRFKVKNLFSRDEPIVLERFESSASGDARPTRPAVKEKFRSIIRPDKVVGETHKVDTGWQSAGGTTNDPISATETTLVGLETRIWLLERENYEPNRAAVYHIQAKKYIWGCGTLCGDGSAIRLQRSTCLMPLSANRSGG